MSDLYRTMLHVLRVRRAGLSIDDARETLKRCGLNTDEMTLRVCWYNLRAGESHDPGMPDAA